MDIRGAGTQDYRKEDKPVNNGLINQLKKNSPEPKAEEPPPRENYLVSQLLTNPGKAAPEFKLGFDDINFNPAAYSSAATKFTNSGLTVLQTSEVSGYKSLKFIELKPEFSETWLSSPINGRYTPPNPNTVYERIKTVESAFKKYPQALLDKNLQHVFLAQTLEFNGAPYGGTNSETNLYLANKDEKTVHHEFSSILLRNYPHNFDSRAWMNINTESYNDPSGGAGAIKAGKAGGTYDEDLMQKGFLTQYSSTSKENDFNVMTEKLFTNDKKLWEYAEKYPKIKEKLNLVLNFYNKLDPMFTREYFKNLK